MEVAPSLPKRRGGDNRAVGQKTRPVWVRSEYSKKDTAAICTGWAAQWERQNDAHRAALGLSPALTVDWSKAKQKLHLSCHACPVSWLSGGVLGQAHADSLRRRYGAQ